MRQLILSLDALAALRDATEGSEPDLAAAAIRPRPGSSTASVAFLGGTGIVGMRAVDDLSILYARVFRPDFAVFSADCWTVAEEAVRAVGLFGNDWHLWEETTAYSD